MTVCAAGDEDSKGMSAHTALQQEAPHTQEATVHA